VTSYATSADGTRIAFERLGEGPPVIVVGDVSRGGAVPEELVRALTMPTLVISGSASPGFFQETAARIAELLPIGAHVVLEGRDHGASADAVGPVVAEFVA
jgi:pimeloyl-ACP methyl ester carboxylesterase